MAWNKPVTNTKPATQTDEGPYGSTRAKSDDGRYTASVPATVPEQGQISALDQAKTLFKFRKKQRRYKLEVPYEDPEEIAKYQYEDDNKERAIVDKNLNAPLFERLFRKYFINKYLLPSLRIIDQTVNFRQATAKEDRELGIDYYVRPISVGDNFMMLNPDDEENFYDIDLKSPNGAHGTSKEAQDFYDNPQISFTLYKKKGKNYYGKGNYYTSKASHNCYIIAKTNRTDKEIAQGMEPEITNAKMYFAPAKNIHNYLNERVLGQNTIKNIINKYRSGWTNLDDMIEQVNSQGYDMRKKLDKKGRPLPDSYIITVPVPGENFGVDIALNKYNENRSDIRMFASTKMFYTKELRNVSKRQPVSFPQGFKLNK